MSISNLKKHTDPVTFEPTVKVGEHWIPEIILVFASTNPLFESREEWLNEVELIYDKEARDILDEEMQDW